jgi:quercetin dioxygenase-like cupin family protein
VYDLRELFTILNPDFTHTDERGKLVQLCKSGYNQINVLYTKAGTLRGEHCHKINTEAFYIISGSLTATLIKGEISTEKTFIAGDFFSIPPFVKHSMIFNEDTVMVAMYDKTVELENNQKDIYR